MNTPSARVSAARWPIVAAVVGAAMTVGIVVALSGDDAELAGPPEGGPVGISHVHGLGVNPADGALIVATHHGTFRMSERGAVERVGSSYQDTMGFTVAGPDRFLGSGHPDAAGLADGQPTRLGLIESTDAGKTWRSLSLAGEADFHGLVIAADRVYGWDSSTGRFMVTTDRVRWVTRSNLEIRSFVVDPDDPEHLIASSVDGLVESDDGGRTWETADAPPLVALSWDQSMGAVGADGSGGVWRLDGATWQRVGDVEGEPQVLLVTVDGFYAATVGEDGVTSIYESLDEGVKWTVRYRDPSR